MRIFLFITLLSTLLICPSIEGVSAIELSGYVELEGRLFFNDALYQNQKRDSASIAFQPELYHEWSDGSSFTFTPFARFDSADPERTHQDIRELNFLWLHDGWELRAGIGKVFWGVTEFLHLVDIINQTDLVEDIDTEDKLGQPMLNLSVFGDAGTLDLFVLPYFRDRTFPGRNGRFRTPIPVDTKNDVYESGAEEYHIDLAVRYSHTIGDWDFGIYYFDGTGREPVLQLKTDSSGKLSIIPFYEQIRQTGLDVQAVKGNWLLKLEAIYRDGFEENFFASVGGFEYTFINIAASGIDLGLIGEWAYDERGQEFQSAFNNDLMLGTRLAFNDPASTEVLIGYIEDLDRDGSVLTVESSRRLGNNWKINLDAFFVFDAARGDAFYVIREDHVVELDIQYYF
jgi:hypothetical protein